MATRAEYITHTPESSPFTIPPSATLIGVTTAPLSPEDFAPKEWARINAATTIAGEAARTCYSSQPKTPLDYLRKSDNYRAISDSVVKGTLEAGHLTTRQHVHYNFVLGMSRNLAYLTHSYPFYNSEEMSQRYVAMSEGGLILQVLNNSEQNSQVQEAGVKLMEGYHQLTEMLIPLTKQFYLERFPAYKDKEKWAKQVETQAQKKAQEIARYCLPVGMQTNMYHTISELTLLRLHRLSKTFDINPEAEHLIQSMIDAATTHDPSLLNELDSLEPITPTQEEQDFLNSLSSSDAHSFFDQIDEELANKSALVETPPYFAAHLVRAIRLTIPTLPPELSDEEIIALALNPKQNRHLADTLGTITMDQLSQAINQSSISVLVAISRTGDAQLQRHRGFDHTRPIVPLLPRLEQDIVIPQLIKIAAKMGHSEILEAYLQIQNQNIETMRGLLEDGSDPNQVAYLQTNATKVRKAFNGPLGAFYHWVKSRTCLNAQEEIYGIALGVAKHLHNLDPVVGKHFDKTNPCGIRHKAGTRPYCPEGKLYCGVPTMWTNAVDDYPTERPI